MAKVATKSGGQSYKDLRAEAFDKKVADRRPIAVGRDGEKRVPRRYGLSQKKAAELRKQQRDTGKFVNPHRPGSVYWAVIEACRQTPNKPVPFADFRTRITALMKGHAVTRDGKKTNAWSVFLNREARNEETGKNADGRLMQTVKVLQRLTGAHPYGERLRQMLSSLDIVLAKDGQTPCIMLHTGFSNYQSVKPVDETKGRRRGRKAKPKAAKPKAKPKAKAKAKAKKTVKKATKTVRKPKTPQAPPKVATAAEAAQAATEAPPEAKQQPADEPVVS